jgi:hypothetical protein
MENKDISQIALEKIRESGIKPIPRSIFDIKKFLFWFLVSISIIIGAISFSIILSLLVDNDWVLFNKLGFNFILKTIPYFWIICLAIFTVLAKYYYRKTLLGHRKNVLIVIGLYGIITIFFGVIIYFIEAGEIIENYLYNSVPIYKEIIFDKEDLWDLNEKGLLSGIIVGVDNNILELRDRNGYLWTININKANINEKVNIERCLRLRIIGDKINEGVFNAGTIEPWIGRKTGQVMEENCLISN